MHYKRKAHRGRHKRNTMDNNNFRFVGNTRRIFGGGGGGQTQ